jgi:zinc D-Ala-D-Ala dipeptidase
MDRKGLASAGFTSAAWLTLCSGCLPGHAAELPPDFVRLADVAPSVVQDMRYAGTENFTGRPVPGYAAPQCWLRREVAVALLRAAEEAQSEGLRLVVHDCYRPVRATKAFLQWAEDSADQQMKASYYPNIDKRTLFDLGYIAKVSTHSRGIAVDCSFEGKDFGTPFDMFDEKSATHHPAIIGEAKENRIRLQTLMAKYGFENLATEWWHFTFMSSKDASVVDVEIR